jgi:protein-disulfide isomerase
MRTVFLVGLLPLLLLLLPVAGCGAGNTVAHTKHPAAPPLVGSASAASRFASIPQSGDALGSPHAPYTLFEFADLQCPFCARFDRNVLPAVIQTFVRTGRLRIELHPIIFIGPQSGPAAAATIAAGLQNRMWQFADLFYRNQQRENSGYVTPRFIDDLAGAVTGLDVATMARERRAGSTLAAMRVNLGLAASATVRATPDFRLGRTGGVLLPFVRGAIPRDAFIRRLGAVVGR